MTDALSVSDLATLIEKAQHTYHNGLTPTMTDDAYDAAVDQLRELDPAHPLLSKVGAPPLTGDEVLLPIPLPSLNKIKDQTAIGKWATAASYHVSVKLDGCSALWLPQSKKLYTRGDGTRGRDISAFAPYFQGLASAKPYVLAVRGELILRADSPAVPQGKMARNIVAGALNRKEVDPTLFSEIRFVAYELVKSSMPGAVTPEQSYKLLAASFEVAASVVIPAADLTEARLSQLFTELESVSPYQMDGIVLAPNMARPAGYVATAANPVDRVAWKTRIHSNTARTTVRSVEWSVSRNGYLIPRVLFDMVTLAGANIRAATGLHGRWIYENGIGPGAEIEVRRAGDVIPQIIAVHAKVSPAMPARWEWVEDTIHIKPMGDDVAVESACIQLTHALGELGAENVGPGMVAKLYAAGFTTLRKIYDATVADIATTVEGCKTKMAERIYDGLRVKQSTWTELNLMVASCTMPRGVGHTKLTPLLKLKPDPATWVAALDVLKKARPTGLSENTIVSIVDAIPSYIAWKTAAGPGFTIQPSTSSPSSPSSPSTSTPMVVVFTGIRDKELEAALEALGHIIGSSITKKTTHVVSAATDSAKLTKAKEMGIIILSPSQCRANLTMQ